MKFTTTVEADLSVQQLALLFADLDDDEQARFFVEVARVSHMQAQAWHIGRHLAKCACSTDAARALIAEINDSMRVYVAELEPENDDEPPTPAGKP